MTNGILAVLEVDFIQVIAGVVIIAVGFISVVELVTKLSVIFGKPVKWVQQKQDDHEKLKNVNSELHTLKDTHKDDIKTIGAALDDFINDISNKIERIEEIQKSVVDELADLAELKKHATENYMSLLRLTIMSNEMPIGERIIAGHKYLKNGGNGEVKKFLEKEFNITDTVDEANHYKK